MTRAPARPRASHPARFPWSPFRLPQNASSANQGLSNHKLPHPSILGLHSQIRNQHYSHDPLQTLPQPLLPPRTPWGRLPQNRPGQSQNYLRASENEKRGLSAQPTEFERSMDKNNVPRSLQSMPTPGASDKTPAAKFEPGRVRPKQGLPGMDSYEDSVNTQKKWDENGVPRRLQSQIIPQGTGQVAGASQQPALFEQRVSRMADGAFPPPQPQATPAATGPDGIVASTLAAQFQQQIPSPNAAAKTNQGWEKKKTENNLLRNPLNFNGIEAVPSVNPHGGSLQIRVPWEQFFPPPIK